MSDVFVSYARTDRDRVAPLVAALEAAGFSVWWDARIRPGAGFDRDIQAALDASRCVLAIWSEASVNSDWVREEAHEALRQDKLLPVRIDPVDPPLGFRSRQTLDLDADAPATLVAAVTAALRAEPTAAPARAADEAPSQAGRGPPRAAIVAAGALVLSAVTIGIWLLEARPADTPDTSAAAGSTGTADVRPVVAVLPFANRSGLAEDAYFADGVAEEILNRLARNDGLAVISRSSAFSFRDRDVTTRAIAAELGTSHLLEGSVRRSGDRIRLTVQLIDARRDEMLWSETFDRSLEDIFAVQDEVARAVEGTLSLELSELVVSEMDIEAFDILLEARHLQGLSSDAAAQERAFQLLLRATSVDPENSRAWAQLARMQLGLVTWFDRSAAALVRVREYAEEALARDPDDATAHVALGGWATFAFEFERAETHLRRALELQPGSTDALDAYSDFLIIAYRMEEALPLKRRALRQDPLTSERYFVLAMVLMNSDGVDEGLQVLEQALRIDPGFLAPHLMAVTILDRRTGNRAAGDAWLERNGGKALPVPFLQALEQERSASLSGSLDVVKEMIRSAEPGGYPPFIWPYAPTEAWVLALDPEYAALWSREPLRRLVELRGDARVTEWKALRERAEASASLR